MTYSELIERIANTLARPDLQDEIPGFIELAEARFRRRWRDVEPLGSSNPTNWLLEAHPDVYLYGALVESAPYMIEDERIPVWEGLYESRAAEVVRHDADATLEDYGGLVRSVAQHLHRPDLDHFIPQFIRLAESTLARDDRVRTLTCRGTFRIAEDGDALPDDYAGVAAWYHDGPTYRMPITVVGTTAALGPLKAQYGPTGAPRYAAIADRRVYYAPEPDGEYETRMTYRRRILPLGDARPTNWLLEEHPDLYLYATLLESAMYLGPDPRLEHWRGELERRLEELERDQWDLEFTGQMRRIRRPIGG